MRAARRGRPHRPCITWPGGTGCTCCCRRCRGAITPDAYDAVASSPAAGLRWDRMFALFGQAVLAGRAGDGDEAVAAVAEALSVGAPYAMGRHLGLRLVAEAALADGWGNPVDWLRDGGGLLPLGGRAGGGERVPGVAAQQRGDGWRNAAAGVAEIPPALRSAGLTVREYEVLRLLADRLGNREIADRLHLSTRTVEKHVSSLITKTGLPNRIALSKYAVTAADRPTTRRHSNTPR